MACQVKRLCMLVTGQCFSLSDVSLSSSFLSFEQFSLFPEDSVFLIELFSPEAFIPPEDFPFSLGFLFFLMTYPMSWACSFYLRAYSLSGEISSFIRTSFCLRTFFLHQDFLIFWVFFLIPHDSLFPKYLFLPWCDFPLTSELRFLSFLRSSFHLRSFSYIDYFSRFLSFLRTSSHLRPFFHLDSFFIFLSFLKTASHLRSFSHLDSFFRFLSFLRTSFFLRSFFRLDSFFRFLSILGTSSHLRSFFQCCGTGTGTGTVGTVTFWLVEPEP